MRTVVLVLMALMTAQGAVAEERTVREFRGSGNTTTAAFTVEDPWLLDWRLDGDYANMIALDVALIDARNGNHLGRILLAKHRGNGLKLFREGGEYKLRISSTLARWTFKIKQIEPEDAERYTAREPQ